MGKGKYLLGMVLVLAVLLIGCGGNKGAEQKDNKDNAQTGLAAEQVVKIGMGFQDTTSMDPHKATTTPDFMIDKAVFNGLVRYQPGNVDIQKIEGDLAESWKLSDDKLSYTFSLRKGVKWHKGLGEVTAEDVKFSLERILDPKTACPDRAVFANISKVDATDKNTVVVTFKKPDPFFLINLSGRYGFIVPKAAVEKYGNDFRNNLVGSGPFQLESYLPKEKIVLAANDDYFRGKPIVRKIELIFIPDENARISAFLSGKVDAADPRGNAKEFVKSVKEKGARIDYIGPGVAFYLFLDTTMKPFDDVRVRKALAHAVDFATYVKQVEPEPGKNTVPSVGMIPASGTFGFTSEGVEKFDYNPQKAKQLLTEAGYPNGFKITQQVSSVGQWMNPWVYIQDQLKKNTGIEVEIKTVDNPTFTQKTYAGENRPVTLHVIFGTPDGFQALSPFLMKGQARNKWVNYDKVDALLKQAENEFDAQKRKKIYEEAQRTVSKDCVAIPAWFGEATLARHPYLDLGHEPRANFLNYYELNEKLRVLKH